MKMPEERNLVRLRHISDAISKIKSYTKELDRTGFYNDTRTNEAVLFQLTVIGEAVLHVDNALLEKYQYPWYKIRALRNVITHEYFGIKLDKIWNTIIHDLPELKDKIEQIINKEF